VYFRTDSDDRFDAREHHFEYLGTGHAIYTLWFLLTSQGNKHVYVYDMSGAEIETGKGHQEMLPKP
jgi:hypothetical protein